MYVYVFVCWGGGACVNGVFHLFIDGVYFFVCIFTCLNGVCVFWLISGNLCKRSMHNNAKKNHAGGENHSPH